MITKQQIRDAGRRTVFNELSAKFPRLSRSERRKLAMKAHRTAWKRSKQRNVNVIAEIVDKQRRDTEIANKILEVIA